jgi:hypothetical protein
MHALMITFTSAVATDQLTMPFQEYAQALTAVPGLVAKTWIADETTLGGFHLFDASAAADDYLEGALLASVRANPAFSEFTVTRFHVLEGLSAVTNGLGQAPLVERVRSDR